MTTTILEGDCLQTLATLDAGIVQTCVTSPPYYGLRSYVDADSPDKPLEIGLEESPEAYVEKLVQVFREVRRVLKPDGTLWLNLGDSYAGSGGAGGDYNNGGLKEGQPRYKSNMQINRAKDRSTDKWSHPLKYAGNGIKPKDLIGIPWMVAFALRADGWYLRSDIIWAKPNPMPESVTDRPTKSHEYIFLLSKSAQYYYDAEAIMEQSIHAGEIIKASNENAKNANKGKYGATALGFTQHDTLVKETRNKRDVWTVNSKPFSGAHFATFPPKLIEPCILAGTSEKGECPECGKAWVRENNAVGWGPDCDCFEYAKDLPIIDGEGFKIPHNPVPQTVLDPFNGSGTTGAVAIKHHRSYIGCELNPDYITLTNRRLSQVQPVLFAPQP